MNANIAIPTEIANNFAGYSDRIISPRDNQTMTSLQVAELTGKRHDAVLRDIRNLLDQGVDAHNFVETYYLDRANRQSPCYELNHIGCLILASGYNALLREKIIKRWEELELVNKAERERELVEREKRVANVQLQNMEVAVFLIREAKQDLRLNDASVLGMYQSIAKPYGIAIPQYVTSQGVTKSAKELLKEIGSPLSAIAFNKMLEAQGYVTTISRPTAGGGIRRFKNITDKGKAFGENKVNPKNQNETQPHWYVDKFTELYNIVTA